MHHNHIIRTKTKNDTFTNAFFKEMEMDCATVAQCCVAAVDSC